MLLFDTIPPEQFSILATLMGALLASDLDSDEQNALGNFLVSVGQSILTIAAQAGNIEDKFGNQNISNQLDQISNQIDCIKKQIKK